MIWPFVKYAGCGNDFILFDNRSNLFPTENLHLIAYLCHRNVGIGADGIILLMNSDQADYKMRIFNSDGSEAEMCGNGLRCLAQWINHLRPSKTFCTIETKHSCWTTSVEGNQIKVFLDQPIAGEWERPIIYFDEILSVNRINTGVPHIVVYADELSDEQFLIKSHYLRWHANWEPEGSNVNWIKEKADNRLEIRTYERGVEGETLACGTGAIAAALTYAYLNNKTEPIEVITRSGESLHIEYEKDDLFFKNIRMLGKAQFIFEGVVDLQDYFI